MKLKLLFLFSVVLLFTGRLEASKNETAPLNVAQQALAAGDYGKAYDLYQKLAESESDNKALAGFSLGLFHSNGWGRTEDPVAACLWFDKAAQGGIPYAQHLYGECLEQGVGTQVDLRAAAHWYERAVEGGYLLSNCYLGRLYMTGGGVEKSPNKALALCYKAVASSPVAMLWMGRFYLEGDESVRDHEKAVQWFGQAAQYDLPEANYYLAVMIEQGLIKTQSPQYALQQYEQAAAKKFVPAYFPAGRLYLNAPADPQTGALSAHDLAKAYMWLSAAKQQSQNKKEIAEADVMLKRILEVMPASWLPDLDKKLSQHLAVADVIH